MEKKRLLQGDLIHCKSRALHSSTLEDVPEKENINNNGEVLSKEEELALEMGEFEDPFEDEYESEEAFSEEEVQEEEEEKEEKEEEKEGSQVGQKKQNESSLEEENETYERMDVEQPESDNDENDEKNVQVYLPGAPLEEGEELQVDLSAYHMLHSLSAKWPCLSFDILRDKLGIDRTTFPHTAYIVAGSQADRPIHNEIYIMKMSRLCKTKHDHDLDDEESDDEIDEDPILEHRSIKFFGGVNRIRAMPSTTTNNQIVAAWSETGRVQIYDLTNHFNALDTPGLELNDRLPPLFTVSSHKTEGFALDWSSKVEGRLLSGDCSNAIHLTEVNPTGFATTMTFTGHSRSVEDLQWSPNEPSVFASCSVDGTVKLYDTRLGSKPGISSKIASCDVNVISWNPLTTFLLASGHDDGVFSIWDLRMFSRAQDKKNVHCTPAAQFDWHKKAITSLEWHSHEESMIAVAGADDQITLWDLSTEKDEDTMDTSTLGPNHEDVPVPAQLLFIHQGQDDVKELHWHSQIPGCLISTSASGFNVFKTINS